jgi:hypothetical protein
VRHAQRPSPEGRQPRREGRWLGMARAQQRRGTPYRTYASRLFTVCAGVNEPRGARGGTGACSRGRAATLMDGWTSWRTGARAARPPSLYRSLPRRPSTPPDPSAGGSDDLPASFRHPPPISRYPSDKGPREIYRSLPRRPSTPPDPSAGGSGDLPASFRHPPPTSRHPSAHGSDEIHRSLPRRPSTLPDPSAGGSGDLPASFRHPPPISRHPSAKGPHEIHRSLPRCPPIAPHPSVIGSGPPPGGFPRPPETSPHHSSDWSGPPPRRSRTDPWTDPPTSPDCVPTKSEPPGRTPPTSPHPSMEIDATIAQLLGILRSTKSTVSKIGHFDMA